MTLGSLAVALAAGTLSILSPCVLPLLPLVFGAAASEGKWGPIALAIGLSISFVVIGMSVATVSFAVGLDADLFRYLAAVLIVALGLVLTVPAFQAQFAIMSAPVANWADKRFSSVGSGASAQFWVGVLLGAVWSPCAGPTLGAASLLAAQGRDFGQVSVIMFAFGLGAALPLLVLGLLSREAIARWRQRFASASQTAKAVFGVLLIVTGALVLSGLDKSIETMLVTVSPQWLTDLTTRF
jgi:cytochrome c-type biogenesis protein